MIHGEFDKYIEGYRKNLDQSLKISGESSSYFAELKIQKMMQWFPELGNRDIHVLDFGCGDGFMTSFIPRYCKRARVCGVDPSLKSIQEAQEQYPSILFSVNSDASTELAFNDSTFDIVTAAGSFHHIPFTMHRGYMHEITRILKPGGKLIMFELNPLNPLTVYTFKSNPIDVHARMLYPWYAINLGKKYGKTSLNFYCFFPHVARFLRPLEHYMTKIPLSALYALIVEKQ